MEVNTNEEEGCTVGMEVSNKSSEVDISTDMGDRSEGGLNVRGIVYCEEESRKDLGD